MITIQLNEIRYKKYSHPFHLVTNSSWPFFLAFILFNSFLSFILKLNLFTDLLLFYINCLIFLLILCRWFRDIIVESTYDGYHTIAVQKGLYYGFILFIISEIMFFFSFFWTFFHNALSPSIFIGSIWPPMYFNYIDSLGLPLLNTCLLLMSGVTITYSHHALLVRHHYISIDGLFWTLIFGSSFLGCQLYEYCLSSFSINDGIYGSIFFYSNRLSWLACHYWMLLFIYIFSSFNAFSSNK